MKAVTQKEGECSHTVQVLVKIFLCKVILLSQECRFTGKERATDNGIIREKLKMC